jgi:hypothetical protein
MNGTPNTRHSGALMQREVKLDGGVGSFLRDGGVKGLHDD